MNISTSTGIPLCTLNTIATLLAVILAPLGFNLWYTFDWWLLCGVEEPRSSQTNDKKLSYSREKRASNIAVWYGVKSILKY